MLQPVVELHSDGKDAGYFPRTLRYLLNGLGYHNPPLYIGTRTPIRGERYKWEVRVVVYEKITDDGAKHIRRLHYASAPRATFRAGIADAARRALDVLRREEDDVLRNSQFAHFPQRANSTLDAEVMPFTGKDNTGRLSDQVQLTEAMDKAYIELLDEVDDLYRLYDEEEERIKWRENDGVSEEEEDPEEDPNQNEGNDE